jgi:pilus assembly protein CpaC
MIFKIFRLLPQYIKEGLMNKKGSLLLCIPILLCALIFSFTSLPAIAADENVVKLDPAAVGKKAVPIDVIVGKETVLKINKPVQEIKQVSLANNEIADIKPLLAFPTAKMVEVIIAGKKPGITSLIVWDKEGNKSFFDVIVHRERMVEFERERADAIEMKIRSVAPDSNIKVEMAGDTIVLSGTANNRHMVDKIEKVALLYASAECNGISRGESLPAIHAEKTQGKEEPSGYVSVNVSQQAMQQAGEKKAEEALCVLNLITIPEAQQVVLEVKVAQINKTKLKEIGISYIIKDKNFEFTAPGLYTSPDGVIGATAAKGVASSTTTIINGVPITTTSSTSAIGNTGVGPGLGSFDLATNPAQIGIAHFPSGVAAVLRALQENGFGRVLAEPNLIVRSGEIGKFHVGTRIPIQTVTGVGTGATASITYEDVGIKLYFAPEVLETGAIRLKIDPAEASAVARWLTFQGIVAPEIDTRTVSTSVDLKPGESLILAGLLSEEMTKNIQKIPILGDIPILGALFRNTRDEIKELELVFLITPKLSKAIPQGEKVKLPTDNRPTPEEERQFQWIPMPGSGEGADTKTETK